MNNEIKVILDKLNKIVPYASVPKELAYMITSITPQDCKILLDYITNLQEKNERQKENLLNLNKTIKKVKKENKNMKEYTEYTLDEYINYK